MEGKEVRFGIATGNRHGDDRREHGAITLARLVHATRRPVPLANIS